jgi:hypothetical protein
LHSSWLSFILFSVFLSFFSSLIPSSILIIQALQVVEQRDHAIAYSEASGGTSSGMPTFGKGLSPFPSKVAGMGRHVTPTTTAAAAVAATAAVASSAGDTGGEYVTPIRNIDAFQGGRSVMIRARVMEKSSIRPFKQKEGKLATLTLADEHVCSTAS